MRAGAWAALAVVLVAGCSPRDPGSEIAATVMGEKITVAELDSEIRAAGLKAPATDTVRRVALERVVARKLLAKAARLEGLDRAPEVAAAKARASEAFDANLFQAATFARVPAPTPAEVKAYVERHPERFARRTLYLMEELRAGKPADPPLVEALKPTKTLAAAEQVLRAHNVPYRRLAQPMDTLNADPRLSKAIRELPPGEPFILPDGRGFIVGSVRDVRTQPLTGARAEAVARQFLLAERRARALADRMAALRKDTVVYGEGFGPRTAKPADRLAAK